MKNKSNESSLFWKYNLLLKVVEKLKCLTNYLIWPFEGGDETFKTDWKNPYLSYWGIRSTVESSLNSERIFRVLLKIYLIILAFNASHTSLINIFILIKLLFELGGVLFPMKISPYVKSRKMYRKFVSMLRERTLLEAGCTN